MSQISFDFTLVEGIEPTKAPLIDPSRSKINATAKSPLSNTIDYMKSLQRSDGYWWFALEANESIGAEFIFLMHYLGAVDQTILKGISNRILDTQRADGSWALYNDGPFDLSTTIECYFALKLAGCDIGSHAMANARKQILLGGGIEKARAFTKIHLAMFGLIPWDACPAMPVEYILLPAWSKVSIYEFSSWARASIVPLLIFMSLKKNVQLENNFSLEELFANPAEKRNFNFKTDKGVFSWENFFILLDRALKLYEKFPLKVLRNLAIKKCSQWTWDHVNKTEDIYPALAYAAFAFKAMGIANDELEIRKPFEALKMFQQRYTIADVPPCPDEIRDDGRTPPSRLRDLGISPVDSSTAMHRSESLGNCIADSGLRIHQQCCISPVWDTPWMVMALLEAGVPSDDPALMRAGRWLMSKQITDIKGDWAIKNPKVKPGGWSFEFENDYFPDIDDTIEILMLLKRLAIPHLEKARAISLGLDWVVSMQNIDGGWGAFDKNQNLNIVNRIPFSDHSACLDPSSPDITGRMLEFLSTQNFNMDYAAVRRALSYVWNHQEPFGGWWARWGVNYIYGTWCVLTGLKAIGFDQHDRRIFKATSWLESIQREDGGFGESPRSYDERRFVPLGRSTPSQTAWALMGLIAGNAGSSKAAVRAAEYLLNSRNRDGSWDERDYTGTGFPSHFYIRYHGYRHFFPLLALGKYYKANGAAPKL